MPNNLDEGHAQHMCIGRSLVQTQIPDQPSSHPRRSDHCSHVLMDTLLGTVVTVLVVWTEFWYNIGSPSFGTKSVGMLGAILTLERQK